jgi:hypothetical protein
MISGILFSEDAADWRTYVGLSNLFMLCGETLFPSHSIRGRVVHSYDLTRMENEVARRLISRTQHSAMAILTLVMHSSLSNL